MKTLTIQLPFYWRKVIHVFAMTKLCHFTFSSNFFDVTLEFIFVIKYRKDKQYDRGGRRGSNRRACGRYRRANEGNWTDSLRFCLETLLLTSGSRYPWCPGCVARKGSSFRYRQSEREFGNGIDGRQHWIRHSRLFWWSRPAFSHFHLCCAVPLVQDNEKIREW